MTGPTTDQVLDKLVEEAREVVEARDTLGPDEIAEEIGDLLFVMANLARHLKVDPEAALRAASAKFTRRFAPIEDWLAEAGKTPGRKQSGRDGRAVEPRQGGGKGGQKLPCADEK